MLALWPRGKCRFSSASHPGKAQRTGPRQCRRTPTPSLVLTPSGVFAHTLAAVQRKNRQRQNTIVMSFLAAGGLAELTFHFRKYEQIVGGWMRVVFAEGAGSRVVGRRRGFLKFAPARELFVSLRCLLVTSTSLVGLARAGWP